MSDLSITVKGPSDTKLAITVSATATVLELKQLIESAAPESNRVEVQNQRLIFSGRVLKDEEIITKYGLKDGNVIHLVKGARPAGPAAGSSSAAQGVPNTFAAGNQIMGNPLAPLLAAENAGALAGFNPFTEMGVNTNDPNYMASLMNSPEAQANMANMLNNPAVIDQLIASNPELQRMGPQVREIMNSEQFRSMLSNPEALRNAMQMQSMMRGGGGGGGFGGGAGAGAITGGAANAALFNPWASNAPTATAAPGGQAMGAGPIGGAEGMAGMAEYMRMMQEMRTPAQPTTSPEERFQVQLGQLADMGFSDPARNIRALLATGGNVQAAIEYLFTMT